MAIAYETSNLIQVDMNIKHAKTKLKVNQHGFHQSISEVFTFSHLVFQ